MIGALMCAAVVSGVALPAIWSKAEEARRIADHLDDPIAKKTMLDIALSYEQLANLAAARLPPRTPS